MTTYHRSPMNSLTNRLNYAGIRKGIMFTRNKGVEVGVEFTLPTATQVTEQMRDKLTVAIRTIMVEGIKQRMRGRLIVECAPINEKDMLQTKYEQNIDSDLLRLLINTEKRQLSQARKNGELSQWRYFFTIRLNTKQTRTAKSFAYLESEATALIQRAEAVRDNLVTLLNTAGFEAQPMSSQQVYELCWRFYNPSMASANPPQYKANPSFKPTARINIERSTDINEGVSGWLRKIWNQVMGKAISPLAADPTAYSHTTRDQIAETELNVADNNMLQADQYYIQTVNVIASGGNTMAGMVDNLLMNLNGHHVYYVLDMHHLYQPDVRKRLIAAAKDMNVATTDASLGTPDVTNNSKLDRISQTLIRLDQEQESVFEYGLSIILMGRTAEEIETLRETTRSQLAMMGGNKVIVGTAQNVVQYADALGPFNARDNEFMFQSMSENVAHYFPQVGPFSGSRKPIAIYRNRLGGLTGINPEDGTSSPGTLIIGSAGSGKTFFSQGYMSRIAAMNAQIIAVDMKSDYKASFSALGGQIIPFYPGERVRVKDAMGQFREVPIRYNAFELDDGETEPDEEQKLFLLGFITILLNKTMLSAGEKAIITATIDEVYKRNLDIDLQGNRTLKTVTLSQFVDTLNNLNSVNNISLRDYAEGEIIIKDIALGLQTFIGEQVMGTFLDGESTIDLSNKYLYFDLNKMEGQTELMQMALMLIMRVMWKKAKRDRDTIKLEIIEEIGVLFKIQAAMDFVTKIYKLGRAYRMWPVAITQEIDDFRLGKGLINNTSQFIIGKVSPEEAQNIAEVLQLNEATLGLINSLGGEPGVYREYLALSVKQSGTKGDVIQYFPSKIEYWMYTSAPEEAAYRDNLIAEFGGNATEAIRRLAGVI